MAQSKLLKIIIGQQQQQYCSVLCKYADLALFMEAKILALFKTCGLDNLSNQQMHVMGLVGCQFNLDLFVVSGVWKFLYLPMVPHLWK